MTVAVDAVVYYRIKEPLNAIVRVADAGFVVNIYLSTYLHKSN